MKVLWVFGVGTFACASPARAPEAPLVAASPSAQAPAPAPSTPAVSPPEPPAAPPAAPADSPSVPVAAATAPTAPPPELITPQPAPELARATLRAYYSDLNRRQFDAERYFVPTVKRYITMRNTSPAAINHYMRGLFPKQFESYEYLVDEATVRDDGPRALAYVERVRYYVVKKREFRSIVAEVRVEFDDSGKFVDFHHSRVISQESVPELHE